MRYLFIHDAFPGQFINIVQYLHSEGSHDIIAASRKGSSQKLPVKQVIYDLPAEIQKEKKTTFTDKAFGLGIDLLRKLEPMKAQGWEPDFIISHASTGASYFLRELFPKARFTSLLEWYYNSEPAQSCKDRPLQFLRHLKNKQARNMPIAREFAIMDCAYSPTQFQKSQFPKTWLSQMHVLHEGVDTNKYKPDPTATFEHEGRTFSAETEIITYAARGMERTRGFPQFMESVAILQKRRPKLHVLIAAADRICYDDAPKGPGLKEWAHETLDFDPARTHFLGLVPETKFVKLLQVSRVHLYLTTPFVLSWSMLNAMSCGAVIVGSDTEPVREVIQDCENGFLVPFDDIESITEKLDWALAQHPSLQNVRDKARETVCKNFDQTECLKKHLALIHGSV